MILVTDSIGNDGFFDPRYTCDFDNSSPELRWSEAPERTLAYALIASASNAQGPQSEPFAHWVIFNIPASLRHLPAGIPAQESLPNGIRQGVNSYGKLGYSGPCPKMGVAPQRYVFRLYALAELPAIPSRATREVLLDRIAPFVIATAETSGLYKRYAEQGEQSQQRRAG